MVRVEVVISHNMARTEDSPVLMLLPYHRLNGVGEATHNGTLVRKEVADQLSQRRDQIPFVHRQLCHNKTPETLYRLKRTRPHCRRRVVRKLTSLRGKNMKQACTNTKIGKTTEISRRSASHSSRSHRHSRRYDLHLTYRQKPSHRRLDQHSIVYRQRNHEQTNSKTRDITTRTSSKIEGEMTMNNLKDYHQKDLVSNSNMLIDQDPYQQSPGVGHALHRPRNSSKIFHHQSQR